MGAEWWKERTFDEMSDLLYHALRVIADAQGNQGCLAVLDIAGGRLYDVAMHHMNCLEFLYDI